MDIKKNPIALLSIVFLIVVAGLLFVMPQKVVAATAVQLPPSGELLSGSYYVPQGGLALTSTLIIPAGEEVTIESEVSSGNGALSFSGANNILVFGKLTVENITISADNAIGTPAINLVANGAKFYSDNMALTQAKSGSADGSATSALGVFVGDIKGKNGGIMPNNTVVSLKNSSVTMTGVGGVANCVRAIGHWNNATGSSIVIDNTEIIAAGVESNNATYGQGVFVRPDFASTVDVQIINGSKVSGFYYPLFAYSAAPGNPSGNPGAKNFSVSDSVLEGYCAIYFRSDGSSGAYGFVMNVTGSTLTARNYYANNVSNGFAAIVTQTVIGGQLNFSESVITAISTQGAPSYIAVPSAAGSSATQFVFEENCVLNCATYDGTTMEAFASVGDNAICLDETVQVSGITFDAAPTACIVRGESNYYFTSPLSAVAALKNNDTLKLLEPFTLQNNLSLTQGIDITIDLNGQVLGLNGKTFATDGALYITDSTVVQDPTVAGKVYYNNGNLTATGGLQITGGVFKQNGTGVVHDVSANCALGYAQDQTTGAVGVVFYTIGYDLAGGQLESENPISYTVRTNTFTLNNPTRAGYFFAGWVSGVTLAPQETVSITKGTTENLSYTASWEQDLSITGVALNQSAATIAVGETLTLQANFFPEGTPENDASWECSESSIVTMEQSGASCTVRALKEGALVIFITTKEGGFTASCTVTVINRVGEVPPTGECATMSACLMALSLALIGFIFLEKQKFEDR